MSIYIAALILVIAVIVLIRHIQGAIDDNKSGANLMDYNNDNKSDKKEDWEIYYDKMSDRLTNPINSSYISDHKNDDD